MYKIILTKPAFKNLKKIDLHYQQAIKKSLNKLAENPLVGQPLKGKLKGLWKLKISRYRIIYSIKNKKLLIIVIAIRHRKDVYRHI